MSEPLFSCSDVNCRVEVSYPAHMLAVAEGEPICENCYNETSPVEAVAWSDLPSFIPPYQARIEELEATLSDTVAYMKGDISGPAQKAGIIAEALRVLGKQ